MHERFAALYDETGTRYSMTVINFDVENFGSIIVIVVQNVQCNKFENLHVPYCTCP